MYNKALKEEFMEQKKAVATFNELYLIGVFNRCEPYEKELNKDIRDFSSGQIENMFRTMGFVSTDSIRVFCSTLSTYTSWCLGRGLVGDSQNYYAEFDGHRLGEMVNQTQVDMRIVSRDEVMSWCAKLDYYTGKVILLGLFEGICGQNFAWLLNMRIGDLEYYNNRININGKWFYISKELTNYMVAANEEEWYIAQPSERRVYFEKSDLIVKERLNVKSGVSDFRKGRRIYFETKRIFSFLGVERWMTTNALVVSGQIHYIKEESAKRQISPEEYIQQYQGEIEARFNRRFDKWRFILNYGRYLC